MTDYVNYNLFMEPLQQLRHATKLLDLLANDDTTPKDTLWAYVASQCLVIAGLASNLGAAIAGGPLRIKVREPGPEPQPVRRATRQVRRTRRRPAGGHYASRKAASVSQRVLTEIIQAGSRGITRSEIADALDMIYSTTRVHIKRLYEAGRVDIRDDGTIVACPTPATPESENVVKLSG
jgi:DNA-binding transcriptional ArsR family regulator